MIIVDDASIVLNFLYSAHGVSEMSTHKTKAAVKLLEPFQLKSKVLFIDGDTVSFVE